MKKKVIILKQILFAVTLMLASNISFAQTPGDTVKTDKTDDPRVVDPGEVGDSMVVKPGKTNDAIAAFTDTGFISKNIMDNMMELELAKSGQNKGTSSQVKRVAALIIKNHSVMLDNLKKLAAKKGISEKSYIRHIPSSPLNIPSGSNFDKTWATEMLTMHEAKIAELENYINLSTDDDIKAAASLALPKIKKHREMLMKIPGALSKTRLI